VASESARAPRGARGAGLDRRQGDQLVSLVVSAPVAAAGEAWFGRFEAMLHLIEFALSVVVMTGLFALMYKLLPAARIVKGSDPVLIGKRPRT